MKRLVAMVSIAALVLSLLVVPASAGQLVGAMVANTGPFQCGVWAPGSWTNTTGAAVYLKATSFWMSGGQDYTIALQRGEMTIHYATPQAGNYAQRYGGDVVAIFPGQTLHLWAHCAGSGVGQAGVHLLYKTSE